MKPGLLLPLCFPLVLHAELPACPTSYGPPSDEDREVYVRAAALTPDGRLIVAGHAGGRVEVIDAETGELLRDLEPKLTDDARELAFSPDGRRLAGLSLDGNVMLWAFEGHSGERLVRIAGPLVALFPGDQYDRGRNYGSLLLWSPDGDHLAVADHHGNHSLWTADGQLVRRWVVPDPSGDPQLAWSPDGGRLITADDHHVVVRSARTGDPIDEPGVVGRIECPDAIVSLALHPDGELLATGHWESCLRMWSLRTGELLSETNYPDAIMEFIIHDIADLAFSPSGDRLALSTREGSWIHVLDTATLEELWRSGYEGGHFSEVMQLSWSSDGSRLWYAFACGGGRLEVVEPVEGEVSVPIANSGVPSFPGPTGLVANFAGVGLVSPDGRISLLVRRSPYLTMRRYWIELNQAASAYTWSRYR